MRIMGYGLGVSVLVWALSGCMYSPASGTPQESNANITVAGLAFGQGQLVKINARNWDTDSTPEITTAVSTSSEWEDSNYFYWSKSILGSSLAQIHWRPNMLGPIGGPAFNAMGRLELSASQESTPFLTFSERAQDCVQGQLDAGADVRTAGEACDDGDNVLVRFDVSGWNRTPLTTGFANVATRNNFTFASGEGSAGVRVQIVSYASPDAPLVHGMICSPQDSAHHPLALYNHGGALGSNVEEAAMCLDYARRGWTMALSAYRGEALRVPPEWGLRYGTDSLTNPPIPPLLPSTGRIEINLGEVLDVLRFLQLLQTHANVDPDRVFMWGGSHGGGITLRAVQSGARVKAAAAIAPSTDWADLVRKCQTRWNACPPPAGSCIGPLDGCRVVLQGLTLAAPDNSSVRPTTELAGGFPPLPGFSVNPILRSYDWRSALFFANDLSLRKDVTLLVQHGTADNIVTPDQSCKLAAASFESSLPNAWYRPTGGGFIGGTLSGCPGVTFSSSTPPSSSWTFDQRYLFVYSGVGHEMHGSIYPWMKQDFDAFRNWLETSWGM